MTLFADWQGRLLVRALNCKEPNLYLKFKGKSGKVYDDPRVMVTSEFKAFGAVTTQLFYRELLALLRGTKDFDEAYPDGLFFEIGVWVPGYDTHWFDNIDDLRLFVATSNLDTGTYKNAVRLWEFAEKGTTAAVAAVTAYVAYQSGFDLGAFFVFVALMLMLYAGYYSYQEIRGNVQALPMTTTAAWGILAATCVIYVVSALVAIVR